VIKIYRYASTSERIFGLFNLQDFIGFASFCVKFNCPNVYIFAWNKCSSPKIVLNVNVYLLDHV
jgi:hypothetical protein